MVKCKKIELIDSSVAFFDSIKKLCNVGYFWTKQDARCFMVSPGFFFMF